MAKLRNKRVIFVGLALSGALVWVVGGQTEDDSRREAAHLANRVWVERMPKSRLDVVGHFVALEVSRGRFGSVGRASHWRAFAEGFRWAEHDGEMVFYFPQQDRRANVPVHTWACEGEVPAPFELCLQFGTGARSQVFYSRRRWKVRPHAESFVVEDGAKLPVPVESLVGLGVGAAGADGADHELRGETVDWLPGEPLPVAD
ncbi:MAG: hypothetical protein B7733_08335 [Myxococcales bacterium FL481]|nr:MAG: hypothetical protein B7733_08335 [Myxococcales bacterium FL481]